MNRVFRRCLHNDEHINEKYGCKLGVEGLPLPSSFVAASSGRGDVSTTHVSSGLVCHQDGRLAELDLVAIASRRHWPVSLTADALLIIISMTQNPFAIATPSH